MLTLTPSAVEVVNTMTEASDNADSAGLRIAHTGDEAEVQGLEVEFVAGPAAEDQVLNQDGARVFLESRAATFLDDKVLHGELDGEGHVRFGLTPQNDGQL
jgi:Fe-S cluster assembly iron-binding protein IscA